MNSKHFLILIGFVLAVSTAGALAEQYMDTFKQAYADAKEERQRRGIPHIVTSVDDCNVYKFENEDGVHYFTRCADAGVTTESTQPVSLAKNTDGQQTEVIDTNGGAK